MYENQYLTIMLFVCRGREGCQIVPFQYLYISEITQTAPHQGTYSLDTEYKIGAGGVQKELYSRSVDTSHHIILKLLVSPNLQKDKKTCRKS